MFQVRKNNFNALQENSAIEWKVQKSQNSSIKYLHKINKIKGHSSVPQISMCNSHVIVYRVNWELQNSTT